MGAIKKKPSRRRKRSDHDGERPDEPQDAVSSVKDRLGLAKDVLRVADLAEDDATFDDRATRRYQRWYRTTSLKFARSLIDEVNAALYGNDDGTTSLDDSSRW